MKNTWFSYIRIDTEQNFVESSGISWNEFYNGIEIKPQGILLLAGYSRDALMCKEIGLEYIPPERISDFVESEIYGPGTVSWADFADASKLPMISDYELADLLFFMHSWRPLKSFMFEVLNNKYAYCSHDDGVWANTYMDCPENYMQVVEYKILKELKGRKRTIEKIPVVIMDKLSSEFQNGAVIDFEYCRTDKFGTGVMIYPIGTAEGIVEIYHILDKRRRGRDGIPLVYDTNTKKWSI
ncbi:MAG: hypothetical protein FWF44_02195 [Defluviitaleaceae bacterium]|nr:hypothetical protein [Defluviitaleaceae bacterium]